MCTSELLQVSLKEGNLLAAWRHVVFVYCLVLHTLRDVLKVGLTKQVQSL